MTRTVALADDAYDALARLKKPGQSFSDVVRDLTVSRRPTLDQVLPPQPTKTEDAHWKAFQKQRRKARQTTAARVNL